MSLVLLEGCQSRVLDRESARRVEEKYNLPVFSGGVARGQSASYF